MKFTVTLTIYTIIFLSFYVVAAPDSDESDEDDGKEARSIFQSRVIGGRTTPAYPHVISLQQGGKHFCAGSLLSPEWILTSAYCWVDLKKIDVEAVAGTKNLNSRNRRIQRRKLSVFIGHDEFDKSVDESPNDIAVAKVDKPFLFDNNAQVSSIDLPEPAEIPKGFGYVAGWGRFNKRNKNDSPVLRHAQIPIHSPTSCLLLMGGSNYTDTNCCAGYMNGDGASCTSDAGGPLMIEVNRRPLKHVLVGIVSWAQECGENGRPGVYTSVSNYIDWIITKIIEN